MQNDGKVVIPGLQGIKGYSNIPKFLVQDPGISIRAKALAIYLYSVQHDNDVPGPLTGTIQKRLGLGRDALQTAKNELCSKGLLNVSKMRIQTPYGKDLYARTTYLLTLPEAPDTKINDDGEEQGEVIFEGPRLQHSYGQLPKVIFYDDRLKSKAGLNAIVFYAYLCSFGGSGTKRVAFPRTQDVLRHLGISKPSFQTARNLLVSTGYIRTTVSERTKTGQFGKILYTITDHNPYLENQFGQVYDHDAAPHDRGSPETDDSDGHVNRVKKPAVTGLKNPNLHSSTELKNQQDNRVKKSAATRAKNPHEAICTGENNPYPNRGKKTALTGAKNQTAYLINNSLLEENSNKHAVHPINPSNLRTESEIEQWIDEECGYNDYIVASGGENEHWASAAKRIMVTELSSSAPNITIGKSSISTEQFERIVSQYTQFTWEYLVDCILKQTKQGKEIRNIRAYMLRAIYNAPNTIDLYYTYWVERDSTT